jgi:hypothetical protein
VWPHPLIGCHLNSRCKEISVSSHLADSCILTYMHIYITDILYLQHITQALSLQETSQLFICTHFQKVLPEYVTLDRLFRQEDRDSNTGRHKQWKSFECVRLEPDLWGRKPVVDPVCKCYHSHVISNDNFWLDSKFLVPPQSMSNQLCNELRTGEWMAFNPATSEPPFSGCRGPRFHLDLVDFHIFWHI